MVLLFVAITELVEDRSFDDTAAVLWTAMLAIQSLPYVATVITAGSAHSRMRG